MWRTDRTPVVDLSTTIHKAFWYNLRQAPPVLETLCFFFFFVRKTELQMHMEGELNCLR